MQDDANRRSSPRSRWLLASSTAFVSLLLVTLGVTVLQSAEPLREALAPFDLQIRKTGQQQIEEGRQIFRFDTFGDQDFWGAQLRLHEALATVTPSQALGLGLKVSARALPPELVAAVRAGRVNLDDPAVTRELLRLNAVVGVTGFFDGSGNLASVGIQCALCHSTVDNSFSAPGIPAGNIGQRLDGWANRDLNVGAIMALSPNVTPIVDLLRIVHPAITEGEVRAVLRSWGPGKFDAQLLFDGKAVRPDGRPAATLLLPAFGLAGVNNHTWTGSWGTVSYWNALVANLEMRGKGTFFDPRLNDAQQYPIAAAAGFGNKRDSIDLISPKLPALHAYQLSIPAPKPPAGSFDAAAAVRGQGVFNGKADCARCHVPPTFTEPGWNLHTADEIGIDSFQADRSPDRRYRTAPLRGLWTHQKGGFYHDGRFPTLLSVVNHYDAFFRIGLNAQEKSDLVQYLLSL
jgi:hypothetical protein